MARIAIYGSGGFGEEARSLLEDVVRAGAKAAFAGYLDDFKKPAHPAKDGEYDDVVIAIADGAARRKISERLSDKFPFAPLLHPDVVVRSGVKIGKGTIICSGAKLTVDISVGGFVIIN